MRHYRSEADRNIWHGAAEGWEVAGQSSLDPCAFVERKRFRWPWPLPVMVVMAGGLFFLALWRACS